MTADKFARIRELILEAVELEGEERSAFLDRQCGDDLDLRTEIESLLAHEARRPRIFEAADQTLVRAGSTLPQADWLKSPVNTDPSDAVETREASARPPQWSDAGGESIGRYVVEDQLGRGGFGLVYKVRDPTRDTCLALKLLPGTGADDDQRARFAREAQALALLDHPNIAKLHTYEEAEGRPFITIELIEGETLAARIERGPLPVREGLELCRQVAGALETAHDRHIMHRDLKPSNVMVTESGIAKVLDFGLAKAFDATHTTSLDALRTVTRTGMIAGTPGYMSPEQLRGERLDPCTDIWALGCVLFECLSGHAAFVGDTPAAVIGDTLHGRQTMSLLPREIDDEVRLLIARTLVKERRLRIQRARDVRSALERALARLDEQAGDLTPHTRGDDRPVPLTSFIGRERELDEITRYVAGAQDGDVVTLTGDPGCGRSRLASEVVRALDAESRQWSIWVDCSQLAHPSLLPPRLAEALGRAAMSQTDRAVAPPDGARARRPVVVLDAIDSADDPLGGLLEPARAEHPSARFLLTSQRAVGDRRERAFALAPLPIELPSASLVQPAEPARSAAELLLADRAGSSDSDGTSHPGKDARLELLRSIEPLPLAIELVAARLAEVDPGGAVAELDRLLEDQRAGSDLTSSEPQLELAALIDWSFAQLSPACRALAPMLSQFDCGWGTDVVRSVAAFHGLSPWYAEEAALELVRRGFATECNPLGGDTARYRIHDAIRRHLLDTPSTSSDRTRSAPLFYYAGLVVHANARTTGNDAVTPKRICEERAAILACLRQALATGDDSGLDLLVEISSLIARWAPDAAATTLGFIDDQCERHDIQLEKRALERIRELSEHLATRLGRTVSSSSYVAGRSMPASRWLAALDAALATHQLAPAGETPTSARAEPG